MVSLFPPWEILPYESISPHPEVVGQRLMVLDRLTEKGDLIVITSIEAVIQKVVSRDILEDIVIEIKIDDTLKMDTISDHLIRCGYQFADLIEYKGDFGIRGGIFDIFPSSSPNPVRIEFYGDRVESIREFDVATQRSIHPLDSVRILPVKEVVLYPDMLKQGVRMATLFDYLPSDTVIVLDDPDTIKKKGEKFLCMVMDRYRESPIKISSPLSLPELFYIKDGLDGHIGSMQIIELSPLKLSKEGDPLTYMINIKTMDSYHKRFDAFLTQIRSWFDDHFSIILSVPTEGQARRLREMLCEDDDDLEASIITHPRILRFDHPSISIVTGQLSSGFVLSNEKLVFVAEHEIFGVSRKRRFRKGSKVRDFQIGLGDLTPGDFIVHIDYGIGEYLGVKDLNMEGVDGELLEIRYTNNDKLYLPMEGLKFIQKYIGTDDAHPPLDKLGGSSWRRTKEKAKESIKEMAEGLLKLYATREISEGFSFSPDSIWHKEFADSFEYEETDDQLKAINDVRLDMERPKSMDRLVCGDVGYGKTEIAMRAAFKTVMDNKQVAVLVPTTILAQQHLQTFCERFRSFPINIEMLSRFRTVKMQMEILKRLEEGDINIIIGTHRLIQKDIKFKELGLVVIDEEHRFGVAHKEKLKGLRNTVDVLTLTATPIPRTLYLSIMGIRDMSLINTPPQDRLAIKTYIRKFDDNTIREAILREMDRGGQIFFVHNRVESIHVIAQYLQRLVPKARIGIAHGQMPEKGLEDVMLSFINQEIDLLICTTIIESGLDIPSANTIIINRADKFGLAQLYQLRGRIGRDRYQAYAYLLVPGESLLIDEAKKRLRAIEELSELGSGFRLASRDLAIRGAGNILSHQQSGHIAAIGLDLYCRLLEKTVRELKGKPQKEEIESEIDINIKGFIPKGFIPNTNQRLEMYRRLYLIDNLEGIDDIRIELKDRYGPPPESLRRLLAIVELKVLAKGLRIERIKMNGDRVLLVFNNNTPLSSERLISFIKEDEKRMGFVSENTLEIGLKNRGWEAMCLEIKGCLQ
ncbi:MAG: transcription-repair coupling factor, partial [Nitrospinae bacterium]|nr:transcription-repair coupling factor [Nitrospinota bacterium]